MTSCVTGCSRTDTSQGKVRQGNMQLRQAAYSLDSPDSKAYITADHKGFDAGQQKSSSQKLEISDRSNQKFQTQKQQQHCEKASAATFCFTGHTLHRRTKFINCKKPPSKMTIEIFTLEELKHISMICSRDVSEVRFRRSADADV